MYHIIFIGACNADPPLFTQKSMKQLFVMVSDSEQNKECFQCEVTLFIFVRFEFIQSLLFWLRWCFFQQTALLRNKTSIFYIMGPMKLQTNDISEEIIETNFRLPDTCNEQTIRTMD